MVPRWRTVTFVSEMWAAHSATLVSDLQCVDTVSDLLLTVAAKPVTETAIWGKD